MLVLTVAKDLYELLQDGGLTAITALSELCRIMIVAVDFAIVFVITVLSAEDCWADRAGKVFDVILALKSRDI